MLQAIRAFSFASVRRVVVQCSRTDVLRHAATLSEDETLRATVLLAESELLPDLRATSLNEILAIRVLVDHQLDNRLMRDAATMSLDETADRRLDLTELPALLILRGQGEFMSFRFA